MRLGLKPEEIGPEDTLELQEATEKEAMAKKIIDEAFYLIQKLDVNIELERHGYIRLNPIDFSYECQPSKRLIRKILSTFKCG